MTNRIRIILVLVIAASIGAPAIAQIDVRVGIIAYEDFESELGKYEKLFGDLSPLDRSVNFQIAVGTYGEVLQWVDRQLVDIAILTPGAFGSSLNRDQSYDGAQDTCEYLATVQLPAASSGFAPQHRRDKGFHSEYRSVCLVARSSSLRSVQDLRLAAAKGNVEFLFVHPMSVSGCLAPLAALQQIGIQPTSDQRRYSYSHTQSIRLLDGPESTKEQVAFVWDDAMSQVPALAADRRKLPFDELSQVAIPHDVVVSRVGYEHAGRVKQWLIDSRSEHYRFTYDDDWRDRFSELSERLSVPHAATMASQQNRVSLDEISHSLLQYARSQPHPPRLALVLSGGGAKCSYQVGAVSALEEELARLRQASAEEGLDIALVVGTSGGAINSVPIAMGITDSPEGRQAFGDTWRSLDQRDIVRPSLLVRANMVIWFAMIQVALIVLLAGWFKRTKTFARKTTAFWITSIALLQIAIGWIPIHPWSLLGDNHLLHHAWLWLSLGIHASAWLLLAIGLAGLLFERNRLSRGEPLAIAPWIPRTALLVCILALPLAQLLTIMLHQQTLSTGTGMQDVLSGKFFDLIDQHLDQQKLPPLQADADGDSGKRLRDVSRHVISQRLLKRDLVITGSCLSQTTDQLPSDLYFHARAKETSSRPPFGKRGISLEDKPSALLDVVMGSGSIFPVFPSRLIADIPAEGEQIELIDGGFAHNSPVEAAVLWGATHVILLEASPRKRMARGNFLRNATSAFQHLHRQAQLVDTRSRGRVTIYSLSPQPPHMCVLDFAENLVSDSIERGYRDVTSNQGAFQREFGEPVFTVTTSSD